LVLAPIVDAALATLAQDIEKLLAGAALKLARLLPTIPDQCCFKWKDTRTTADEETGFLCLLQGKHRKLFPKL
jgi:hypothetical protein